jgi:hypothetical protein
VTRQLDEFSIQARKWEAQASLVKDAHSVVERLDLDPQLVMELALCCRDDDTAGMRDTVVRILTAVEEELALRIS